MAGLSAQDAGIARKILDDIDHQRFKQALVSVDKKLKKNDSEYFKALQTLIKAHIGQLVEKGAILLQLEELVLDRKHVITDLDTIKFYEDALELVLPKPGESWPRIIGYLRWELVKAMPKDPDASRICFQACLAREDYKHARHIANSLEKNFPGNHEYIFWNITTMFLYSCHVYAESERKLYEALAKGLIQKLADATVRAADSRPLPVRCIREPQELLLMDAILAKGGEDMNSVRLGYLQNKFLGPESAIAKGEWQLWRLKLELLKSQPELLFKTVSDLLKRARTKDKSGKIAESRFGDWIVWESYINGACSEKHKEEVEAEVQAHLDPDSGVDKAWRRNASLASIAFAFKLASPFLNADTSGPIDETKSEGNVEVHNKIDLIVQFLQRYGDSSTAYTDLRRCVRYLDSQALPLLLATLVENRIFVGSEEPKNGDAQVKESLSPLNQNVETASGITQLVNLYKLIFLVSSSAPEHVRRSLKGGAKPKSCTRCSTRMVGVYCGFCLTQLAQATMKSYGLAMNNGERVTRVLLPTDKHPADDLCILAAMCLIKLSAMETPLSTSGPLENSETYHKLQAVALLEYAWSHSKANLQILLMLTRLYTVLGCISLAFEAYQRIGVKQIQHATLSHYMFDQISTSHPHPFTSDSSQQRSVIEEFQEQQRIYSTAPQHISNRRWSSFEHKNYNTIFELEEIKETLAYNVSAVTSVIESRKVSRLLQPNVPLTASSFGGGILPLDIDNVKTHFVDKNDYEAMPNFETIGEKSPLNRISVRMPLSDYRIHMDLFTEKFLTVIDPIGDSVSANTARLWLDNNIYELHAKLEKEAENLTWEHSKYRVYYTMFLIVQESEKFEDRLRLLLDDIIRKSEKWPGFAVPTSEEGLSILYILYELGTSVLKLNGYLVRKKSQAQIPNSFILGKRLVNIAIEKSAGIKKSLDEGGWIDRVLKSVFQGDPENIKDTTPIPGTLKTVIGEDFMEKWAGRVVDSWKDSSLGFAYFKSPAV